MPCSTVSVAPEETPVVVSQRSNKDLEESILPSLSGHVSQEKSLLEQDRYVVLNTLIILEAVNRTSK